MRIFFPILFIVLLEILFDTCEGILQKTKQDVWMTPKQLFISHSNVSAHMNYLRTESFTAPLALKVPSKSSHPEASLASLSPNFKMQLIAGTSTAGNTGDNGPATSAQIRAYFPFVDFSGNIYFGDDGIYIRKVTSTGIISAFGGTGPSSHSGVGGPIGSVSFQNVWSIVGDTGGNILYISDQWYVWKYLFSTGIATVFAHSTSLPQGYSSDGGFATSAQLNNPAGLWLTTSGVLYICDVSNHRVRKIASDNIISTVAGSAPGFSGDGGPAVSAKIQNPYGVYMDTNGRLFIADLSNYRIRLVDTNNIISTFAGTGTSALPVDNILAVSANIYPPIDVKGDSAGNIYIGQQGYCVLQMVNTNNIISSLFGDPNNCGFSAGVSQPSSLIHPPYGVWIDSLSNIYFSDINSIHRSIELYPTSQPSAQPSAQPVLHPSGQPSGQPMGFPSAHPTSQPQSRPTCLPTDQPSFCPSCRPSVHPSSQPSRRPSSQPTTIPSSQPSDSPTGQPTTIPSIQPTTRPSRRPSAQPSSHPSRQPSAHPSGQPSSRPSNQPSSQPSRQPTTHPSEQPSSQPTLIPISLPTLHPTVQPSSVPSIQPTSRPTSFPSSKPSQQPTVSPSSLPTTQPSIIPSTQPSNRPTACPSSSPTAQPSGFPSSQPTGFPSSQPTIQPTNQPSVEPTSFPSSQPSTKPTMQPSSFPTLQPSGFPSSQPTGFPSSQPTIQPTNQPSVEPTSFPSSHPSTKPTIQPSAFPTLQPSGYPSSQPSMTPSVQPTNRPSSHPSGQPTVRPSRQPSAYPTSQPSSLPSNQPTCLPSCTPTMQPTSQPSSQPSNNPSIQPTSRPSSQPTILPTVQPSQQPSSQPTGDPTVQPSSVPSCQPTVIPSAQPTRSPTEQPSSFPTGHPSSQPSTHPSKQPMSSPTSVPTTQPTIIPTAQPFSFPTSAPQATIYQTNGVLFYLGATSSSPNKTHHENNNNVLGSSYILFGRNFKYQNRFPSTIPLDSSPSHEFVSQITNNEAGIRNDITIRSTTIIGDINGDTFLDLLVGYPLASKCSVYLGDGVNDFATIISTTGESFAIIGDPYQGGGFLGWSSIRIGDLNGDRFEEIVVSAIYANTVYVIYGREEFHKIININELTAQNGFQIKGSDQETNFGVGLTLLHHFRKGSRADIAITAQRSTGGQCVVYVLFGGTVFKNPESIIAIDRIMNNSSVVLKIIAPLYSFAGFSMAGVGDINSDGYDDLAIGSVPYDRGKYQEQKTYIIYGRKFVANETELELAQMTSEDGIIITGGGFLVTGVGDVNGDGVADVMICSYYDWKGQSSAYLISTPANMTYSPSLQPSSTPTMIPTVLPSSSPTRNVTADDNSTLSPTILPSFRPSYVPTRINASLTPSRAVYAVGTSRPSAGKPSLGPSLSPTSGYHRLRGFPTTAPVVLSTMMPTINTTTFTEIDCSDDKKEYQGQNESHNVFRITANNGVVKLRGNEEGGAKNIYVLYCPSERVDIVIQNFRVSTDIISVVHLEKAGYSYLSLNDISYSKSDPLTLLFCSESKLQVVLVSYTAFILQENNFLFTPMNGHDLNQEDSKKNTFLARVQIGVVLAVLFFLLAIFLALSYNRNKSEEKRKLKQEEQWFNSLTVPSEELHIYPARSDRNENDQEDQGEFVASDPTLVLYTNIRRETHEQDQSSSPFSSSGSSSRSSVEGDPLDHLPQRDFMNSVGSINSNDWQDALGLSDDDDDNQDQLVSCTEMIEKNLSPSGSSSLSISSLEEEGSQVASEASFMISEILEDNQDDSIPDDISRINSEEWQGALDHSDDEDET
jgi:preprotein translocase subunit SecG